ncbi:hypothetical protein M422DRAFT_29984 [Sphaerobolus stellatus SS14]|uniref:SCP domain-containing protein n=1 Tax=Sphaerobolus stellatus (strain SS14) TaxID=990650 RepID=A0A0C9W2A6_SPHS4|nr:hypothetical protein M422DRAFT_29984 [Sphaerobolus stellatus SS14]
MARFVSLLAALVALSQFQEGTASALPGNHARKDIHAHQKRASTFRQSMGWPGYKFPLDPWGVVIGKESTVESTIIIGSGVAGVGAAPTETAETVASFSSAAIPFSTIKTLPTATFSATIISSAVNSTPSAVSSTSISTSSSTSESTPTSTTSQTTPFAVSSTSPAAPPPPSSSAEASVEAPAPSQEAPASSQESPAEAPSPSPVEQSSVPIPPPSPTPQPAPSQPAEPQPEPTSSALAVAAASSSDGSTSQSDINAYLSAHNTVRAQHGAAALTWSQDLANKAQQWANGCVFKHSGGSLGPFGENLAAGTGSGYGIPQAIKSWTDEVSQYNSNNPQPSHFTQVVWKATTQVGCALQDCDGIFAASFGKAHFYVCEYSPQGNVIGQFPQNVQA